MDMAAFRATVPAFSNVATYPDAAVSFWLGLAASRMNAARWADLFDYGQALFTAHNLSIAAQDAKILGGSTGGAITAKSVDKLSVSYDPSFGTIEEAGAWNRSSYGVQWWQLMQMIGAGPIQIGAEDWPATGVVLA